MLFKFYLRKEKDVAEEEKNTLAYMEEKRQEHNKHSKVMHRYSTELGDTHSGTGRQVNQTKETLGYKQSSSSQARPCL